MTPLLRLAGDQGRVRAVRAESLAVETWTAEEVGRLVAAAPDTFWRTLIEAGWLSGLSEGDLLRITREEIPDDGVVTVKRSRTGRLVTVYLPARLAAHVASGRVWAWKRSMESFRRHFACIASTAGLHGPFKQLRRSAGSNVEAQAPGRGHLYLGNSRAVFERHYLRDEHPLPVRPVDLPGRLQVVG